MDKTGKKFDSDKLPVAVILEQFPRVIEALAAVAQYGHDKYELGDDWSNWSRVENGEFRYKQAEMRHLISHNKGQILDPESGLPHLHHSLWNKIASLELKLRNESAPH